MTKTKSVPVGGTQTTYRLAYAGFATIHGLMHPSSLKPIERPNYKDSDYYQQLEKNYYSKFGGSTWNKEPLSRDQLWSALNEQERKFMISLNKRFNVRLLHANK